MQPNIITNVPETPGFEPKCKQTDLNGANINPKLKKHEGGLQTHRQERQEGIREWIGKINGLKNAANVAPVSTSNVINSAIGTSL